MFKNAKVFILFAILVTVCYKEVFTISYRDRVIGCLFSDVCTDNQVCFDDNAFGRCEEFDSRAGGSFSSTYVYQLDRKTLQLLEKELDRLSNDGFSWTDPYTQCILKTVLNDRPRIVYDSSRCDYHLHLPPSSTQQQQQQPPPPPPPTSSASKSPSPVPSSSSSSSSSVSKTSDKDIDPNSYFTSQSNKANSPTLSSFPSSSVHSSSSIYSDPTPVNPNEKDATRISKAPHSESGFELANSDYHPLASSYSSSTTNQNKAPKTPITKEVGTFEQISNAAKNDDDEDVRPTQLSDELIKSTLRAKHLKRNLEKSTPTSQQQTQQILAKRPHLEDRTIDEQEQEELIQNLIEKLSSGDIDFDKDGYLTQDTESSKKPDLTNYLQYMIENNIPYYNNLIYPPKNNKFDQNDDPLWKYRNGIITNKHRYEPNEIKHRLGNQYGREVLPDYDEDNLENIADNNNDVYIVKNGGKPLFFESPEVRVLRNADEETDEPEDIDLLAGKGDDDEEPSRLFLLDLNDDSVADDNENLIEDQNKGDTNDLLTNIIDDILKKNENENRDHLFDEVVVDSENLMDDSNIAPSGNGDDEQDELKEMLIGDLNYNNNYDSQLPNFNRHHRYDIKKPGPRYLEEYVFNDKQVEEEEPNEVVDDDGSDVNNVHLLDQDTVQTSIRNYKNYRPKSKSIGSNVQKKKDVDIRSHKPVSEGPVKVDGKSENTIIIRSAEEGEETSLEAIDSTHAYVLTDRMLGEEDSQKFVQTLEQVFKLPRGTFSNLRKDNYQITFKVNPNYLELNASQIAIKIEDLARLIKNITGYGVQETGIGDKTKLPVVSAAIMKQSNERLINLTLAICSVVMAAICAAFVVFLFRRNLKFREKIKSLMKIPEELTKFDYQDLCRQRMQTKGKDKEESTPTAPNDTPSTSGSSENVSKLKNVDTTLANQQTGPEVQASPPSRSSTSSWVEEPVSSNMDITTGHIILSYMEDHLKKKDRLAREWEALCAYEAEPSLTNAALEKQNANKNRYPDILPYDHSRVLLNDFANSTNSDYINANTITDHDPRNPAYIVTQGPLSNTKADFWQMIWEQGSVIIVMLTRLRENGFAMCERYWPEEGSEIYQNYEVHLVSEHIWCDDYLVRSFYLKNLKSGETRTVTQFHFLSWPDNGIPPNTKSILDFRRKVNKSYKGRSCPIIVHCSDGVGRTGTYILIDMVLNRLAKGAKEIDIAATLEHIRDQRTNLVKTKSQFEFVLLAVAEEVQAILKALGPNN